LPAFFYPIKLITATVPIAAPHVQNVTLNPFSKPSLLSGIEVLAVTLVAITAPTVKSIEVPICPTVSKTPPARLCLKDGKLAVMIKLENYVKNYAA
jgi:hypothetical protein